MMIEFASHLFAFDFIWIVDFILSNLPWLFALTAGAYFFNDRKYLVTGFIFIVWLLWSFSDVAALLHWQIQTFWMVGVWQMSLIIFLTYHPKYQKYTVVILVPSFFILMGIYTMFFVT